MVMDKEKIITSILPLLSEKDKEEITEKCIKGLDKVLSSFGYTIIPSLIIPEEVVKPKHKEGGRINKKTGRNVFDVNGRNFPSKKKAAEFYGVNYQTAIGKLSNGIPPEQVFSEEEIKAEKRANGKLQ